jgi:predicted molibdopterin-dependent oxidoreductase YjgC
MNNVQGAADMGCQPHRGAGYFAVDTPGTASSATLRHTCRIGARNPESDAALAGTLKAMWVFGEDLGQTDQHQPRARPRRSILRGRSLTTETAKLARRVARRQLLEKSGTFTNGERRIQRERRRGSVEGTKAVVIVRIMERYAAKTGARRQRLDHLSPMGARRDQPDRTLLQGREVGRARRAGQAMARGR